MKGDHHTSARAGREPLRIMTALLGAGLLAASAGALLAGCFNYVQGSGNAATEQREVSTFSEVQVSGAMEVRITIGSPQSVSVTADDNILPILVTEVQGQRLSIRTTKSYRAQQPLITITVPDLRVAEASGSTRMTITGLSTNDFRIGTSGSSNVTIDRLSATNFRIETSGSSDMQANGRADQAVIQSSGSARIRLNDLVARAVEVDSSGSAQIEVQATESLTGKTSGSTNITYSGTPRVSIDSSGSSKVTAR